MQTLQPYDIFVVIDHYRDGEINARNVLLEGVTTEWVAWLDDDDEMMTHHLQMLADAAYESKADLIYSEYETIGSAYKASFIEPAYMARTKALRTIGGFPVAEGDDWPYRYGDWGLLARLLVRGYSFKHVPAITWRKYMHPDQICGEGFEVDESRGLTEDKIVDMIRA
jgi:hypothetical protein